ncbi:MAG: IS200/IS605 family transposase [Bacteroidetes bacterium]|nr:IS200/IS605 family transposase [Bacteroidota bacterium]MCH7771764.1 IS200/IS605 family transposase [Bacteroidota bacterium]MCH9028801.1 IS200/IS605 family transposase [Bacteroidota bacterium]
MANSYTQIYIQYVFAVKYRMNFLKQEHDDQLQKYITGIVQKRKCKMLAINNVPDHMHFFVGLHPSYPVSKLIQEVKAISSKFINDNKWYNNKFQWQVGYGAFSYSHSQIGNVIRYINNQKEHHRKKTFRDEYYEFLKIFGIDYDEKYLFEYYD